MNELTEAIWKAIRKRMNHEEWGCTGCPKVNECEDDNDAMVSRYCEPLIKAAILNDGCSFEIPFKETTE